MEHDPGCGIFSGERCTCGVFSYPNDGYEEWRPSSLTVWAWRVVAFGMGLLFWGLLYLIVTSG